MVEYYVQQFAEEQPAPWAGEREAEGWHGIGQYDHWYLQSLERGVFHPFVVLGNMAAATTDIRLTTTFANNLARSPVEFAQAALTLSFVSNGRFDAGIGAGWLAHELLAAGLAYPPPRERARRFKEAVTVIRQLLGGAGSFEGEFYRVDIPAAGPRADPAPGLIAALGGPWTIKEIGPLVDSIELATMGRAFRHGTGDWRTLAGTTPDQLRSLIDLAHAANPNATIGISLFVFAGRPELTAPYEELYRGGAFEGLAGSPARVTETLQRFVELGVDRITILPPLRDSAAELATRLVFS